MSTATRTERPIGFVVKTYPKLSETFILGEILGLEQLGMTLKLYALQTPTDSLVHVQTRAVKAKVAYLNVQGVRALFGLLRAHAGLMLRHPLRYGRAIRAAIQRIEPNRLRSFLQAGLLAEQTSMAGIKHVHAHFASEPATVAELACVLSGASFSLSAHAKDIYLADEPTLARKLQLARFTVTCTEYNRRHLQLLAGSDAAVHRMYHGIDLARFVGQAADSTPPVDNPLILSVGRLREKKGFGTLIDACAMLRDQGHKFRCEIIGYGPDQAALQAQIARLGLVAQVTLLGKLPQEEVIAAYRRAAMFVLPCQIGADGDRDGIPNVLLEAMAMGLPAVSTEVSGIPEVLHEGKNGLLIPAQDPAALTRAIEQLLRSPEDRERMGQQGRRTVAEHFNNSRNLRLVRDLLLASDSTGQAPEIETALAGNSHGH